MATLWTHLSSNILRHQRDIQLHTLLPSLTSCGDLQSVPSFNVSSNMHIHIAHIAIPMSHATSSLNHIGNTEASSVTLQKPFFMTQKQVVSQI